MWPKSKCTTILQNTGNQAKTSPFMRLIAAGQPWGIGQFLRQTRSRGCCVSTRSLPSGDNVPVRRGSHTSESKTWPTTPARHYRAYRSCVYRRSAKPPAWDARWFTSSNPNAGFRAVCGSGHGLWGGWKRRCRDGWRGGSSGIGRADPAFRLRSLPTGNLPVEAQAALRQEKP